VPDEVFDLDGLGRFGVRIEPKATRRASLLLSPVCSKIVIMVVNANSYEKVRQDERTISETVEQVGFYLAVGWRVLLTSIYPGFLFKFYPTIFPIIDRFI